MPSSYTIGGRYELFVKELVASGRYASASEVLRAGLRLVEEREEERRLKLEALREAIREGAGSGPGIPADSVFDSLEAKYSRASDVR